MRLTISLWHLLKTHQRLSRYLSFDAPDLFRRPSSSASRNGLAVRGRRASTRFPIVTLVTFLIGVVFAYLLGLQAERFGANIFVVDGVGLAICRDSRRFWLP